MPPKRKNGIVKTLVITSVIGLTTYYHFEITEIYKSIINGWPILKIAEQQNKPLRVIWKSIGLDITLFENGWPTHPGEPVKTAQKSNTDTQKTPPKFPKWVYETAPDMPPWEHQDKWGMIKSEHATCWYHNKTRAKVCQ